MKIVFIASTFFFQLAVFAQAEWKSVLNQSLKYYLNKKKGNIGISTIEKNVLKNDTNYYFRQFLYSVDSQKTGKLFYADNTGFSIYINTRTYYVKFDKRSYIVGEGSSNKHLQFLPYWDPASFFFNFFTLGNKYGIILDSNNTDGCYTMHFTNNDDGKFGLNIDSKNYNLIGYEEIYTHPKYGDQYTRYVFEEMSDFAGCDSILDDLDLVLKNYTQTTDEVLTKEAKERKKIKDRLTGNKVNKTELDNILFGKDAPVYSGSFILLDYFYQACLPCLKTIPELKELRTKYDSVRLVIVGVDPMPEDAGHKDKFVQRYSIPYPVVDGDQAVEVAKISQPGLPVSYPSLILIGPDGTIEKLLEGYSPAHMREIKNYLKKHLK